MIANIVLICCGLVDRARSQGSPSVVTRARVTGTELQVKMFLSYHPPEIAWS